MIRAPYFSLFLSSIPSEVPSLPVVGVTGHMNLTTPTVPLVEHEIRSELAAYDPEDLIGVSCIAEGADSVFAQVVLDLGGRLEVVIPAADYRNKKVKARHLPRFDSLVGRAANVTVLPYEESTRLAYEAANAFVLERCERIIAVWDGQSPKEKGGTAEVVSLAVDRGMPVKVIWPAGAERG